MSTTKVFFVDAESEGERVDRYLSGRCEELSRTQIRDLIRDGACTANGKTAKPSSLLCAGDEVRIRIPDPEPVEIPAKEIELDILYEDDDLLVVNKPKGMVVHPAAGHHEDTLVNAVLYHCGDSLSGINGELRPGIVHRIDKDTSGTLLICKNDLAHRCIAAQLKEHTMERVYLGIVHGVVKKDEGRIEGNIGRDPKDRKRMAVVKTGGKEAATNYRVLQRMKTATLLSFRLETGRTHQIRVHMAHIGHPLIGDPLYGPRKSMIKYEGQALHAATLGFTHPRDGRRLTFTAPPPVGFQTLLQQLGGHTE